MMLRYTRLEPLRTLTAALLVAACVTTGCEDEEVTADRRYIALVDPLALTPGTGGTIVVTAEAELRVDWTVVIESVPTEAGATPARHRRRFDDQTQVAFAWDRTHNTGVAEFSGGDSCVARISYPQLDPAALGTTVGFRLP